ncbi:hypothetical protein H6776_01545 [Candidatus Nomurabacteria bacterium]|nr:hypothetical protein [Candidatus Nomurabacteria bacterium]
MNSKDPIQQALEDQIKAAQEQGNTEELEAIRNDAESGFYEDVAQMAQEAIDNLKNQEQSAEQEVEEATPQVEELGGDSAELQERVEPVQEEMKEVVEGAEGEIEGVENRGQAEQGENLLDDAGKLFQESVTGNGLWISNIDFRKISQAKGVAEKLDGPEAKELIYNIDKSLKEYADLNKERLLSQYKANPDDPNKFSDTLQKAMQAYELLGNNNALSEFGRSLIPIDSMLAEKAFKLAGNAMGFNEMSSRHLREGHLDYAFELAQEAVSMDKNVTGAMKDVAQKMFERAEEEPSYNNYYNSAKAFSEAGNAQGLASLVYSAFDKLNSDDVVPLDMFSLITNSVYKIKELGRGMNQDVLERGLVFAEKAGLGEKDELVKKFKECF